MMHVHLGHACGPCEGESWECLHFGKRGIQQVASQTTQSLAVQPFGHKGIQLRVVRAWMISAHSGPIRCTPRTLSLSASTISFMKPRPSLPLIVFFIGLH